MTNDKTISEKISEYALEEIMGERFGRYSKYIIQDRAIPDVRDGLKPVQRRILYSMYKEKNTYDHGYRKSAKTVGDVIGNYHPHGDSSIYEAMVRMSQSWKFMHPYIDMHGNNGSIDGDSPAAYRYTEARLAKISNELLKDIDKETVIFAPNFDDTTLEPTVLPVKYPNLLVNGTNGISAGYATNIPPHNLGEIIEATIKRIDDSTCSLETIMGIVKGPDFPTGGIIYGKGGIQSAYETGRGKIIVRSKTSFEEDKKHLSLIIEEIPFEVVKALLVRKIDEIRIDKKVDGILEVRDESDRDGLRIAIDLKKDCNRDLILNYLLKNTELQVSYNFNMIAIVNRRPKLLGILDIIDAYIAHQKEVVVKRTEFDLRHAKARIHIVEGLIKCLSILDEVIKTIRGSKNKLDARDNLIKEYGFTELQAEAIINLQLYKLTNTDVTLLEDEYQNLLKIIQGLESILNDQNVLKKVMKEDLKKVRDEYAVSRLTRIEDEIEEIKVDTKALIEKIDVIVLVTKDGYVKRTPLRSYQTTTEEATLKSGDYILGLFQANTIDTLLVFTNLGNYLYIPIYLLPDLKWKELGKHVSNIIKLEENEVIISAIPISSFNIKQNIIIMTKRGMIKRTPLKDFEVLRYSKAIACIKLKDNDEVVDVTLDINDNIFVATSNGYGLWFKLSDVPITGLKTSGVIGINLKDDYVVSMNNFANDIEYLTTITNKKTAKRIRLSEFEVSNRNRRGLLLIREVRANPYKIIKALPINNKNYIGIRSDDNITTYKITEFPISDRYSTGTVFTKSAIDDAFIVTTLIKNDEIDNSITDERTSLEPEYEEINNNQMVSDSDVQEKKDSITKKISLKEIDDRLMTIDDFLKDE